jgi:hypothetical protein
MAKFTVTTTAEEAAILADSQVGPGLHGTSVNGRAGFFHSDNQEGVFGESNSLGTAAVAGIQVNPDGTGASVYGEHKGLGPAIVGENLAKGPGARFRSESAEGVIIESSSPGTPVISVHQRNDSSTGPALYVEHAVDEGKTAAFFKGNVIVTGDISFPGADCAEDFTIKADVLAEPGTVMALNEAGELVPCGAAYERLVAGVIAGAGSHRPGLVMDKQAESSLRRQPIALVGKVFCKADADYVPIAVGDLLTSSATEGHAMKAVDANRAFGSVIGKALAPQKQGRGLIPILISLQ